MQAEKSSSERRRRRAAEETVKALRARVAYLSSKVEDAVASETTWYQKVETLRGTLALREQHITTLRTAFVKLNKDGSAVSADFCPASIEEVCITTPASPVLNVLRGWPADGKVEAVNPLEHSIQDWLAEDASGIPEATASRAKQRFPYKLQPESDSCLAVSPPLAPRVNVVPFKAVLAPALSRSSCDEDCEGPEVLWQVLSDDPAGATLLQRFHLHHFMAQLQGSSAGQPIQPGFAPWRGKGPAILAEKLAQILTAWRQLEQDAAATCGSARQASALAEARALRMAVASRARTPGS